MNFAFLLLGRHRNLTPCTEFTETSWVSSPPQLAPPNVQRLVYRALAF
jgi:hypothetical protein